MRVFSSHPKWVAFQLELIGVANLHKTNVQVTYKDLSEDNILVF